MPENSRKKASRGAVGQILRCLQDSLFCEVLRCAGERTTGLLLLQTGVHLAAAAGLSVVMLYMAKCIDCVRDGCGALLVGLC